MRLLLIHGRAQEGKSSAIIEQEWMTALRRGFRGRLGGGAEAPSAGFVSRGRRNRLGLAVPFGPSPEFEAPLMRLPVFWPMPLSQIIAGTRRSAKPGAPGSRRLWPGGDSI